MNVEHRERRRIRDQLRNAMDGGAWHGPSLHEIIGDMTAKEAAGRPLASVHSAWELVLHVAAWLEIVRRRAEGDPARPTEAENFPAVPEVTEAAWTEARARLRRAHEELQAAIERLDEPDLDRPVAGQRYDVGFMLHGVIQHTLYHAGQVAILKKEIRA
jgi:uncharacterized damage-inducible protein DinB